MTSLSIPVEVQQFFYGGPVTLPQSLFIEAEHVKKSKPKKVQARRVLTANDVLVMRARYRTGRENRKKYISYSTLARLYGVQLSTARRAINGDTWQDLPGAFNAAD